MAMRPRLGEVGGFVMLTFRASGCPYEGLFSRLRQAQLAAQRLPRLGRSGGFSRDQMALAIEDIVDGGVGGNEALALELEPLHLSLASSDRKIDLPDSTARLHS